jgi:hypothetical protein
VISDAILCSSQSDFLLITENAQYFNAVGGPSEIIHSEAKKLQEWGLRLINREGAAAVQEVVEGREEVVAKKAATKAGKFAIRIKKFTSPNGSATATPRTATPSRLNQEIKMEEEEDEGEEEDEESKVNDSADDSDGSSGMGTSSGRGASISVDGSGTVGGRGSRSRSPETVRKYTKRATGPRAPYTHKKNRPRTSAVVGLLSSSGAVNNEEDNEGKSSMAPVSSTSGAVAAAIPLVFGPDGSIELEKLTEDERRAILRPAGLDDWPDLLMPYLESIQPLHTDAQLHQQALARPIKSMVDGFSSAILVQPTSTSSSFSYDVSSLPKDQQKSPFAISSGYVFASGDEKDNIPLAWPRLTNSSGNGSTEKPSGGPSNDNINTPTRIAKGRDREKEREAAGVGNLDDWSFPRAHMVKLLEPLDLGLYPGLLPSAWTNHIRSSKGGPSKSRLPPFHLSTGPTLENALQDELASLPSRVLSNGKPGAIDNDAAQAKEDPRDVRSAFLRGGLQKGVKGEEETMKAGIRGSDVIREAVFGGAVGEAYTSSVFDFVRGAIEGAQSRREEKLFEDEAAEPHELSHRTTARVSTVKTSVNRVVPSYFDDAGEMLNSEGYIGMGLIPLDVRKEAGLLTHDLRIRRSASTAVESLVDGKRKSRDVSIHRAMKRQRMTPSTPLTDVTDVKMEDVDERRFESEEQDDRLKNVTSAYLSGMILEKPLLEYVRDEVISPLTGGMLDVLVQAGREVEKLEKAEDQDGSRSTPSFDYSSDIVVDKVGSLLEGVREGVESLPILSEAQVDGESVESLVRKILHDDYHHSKALLSELTRITGDVIELDALVCGKEEMLSESQQTQATDLNNPLRWTSMELDGGKVDKSLEQYALILKALSSRRENGQASDDGETMDKLRLAYVALAKLAPTKELARGQWAAWAEYLQQQMAQQKQSQSHRTIYSTVAMS